MSKYRSVQVSFWQDAFVLDLTPEEKYFYIYLMTNSKANQIGIYELPKRIIETETGYNRETVEKLLNRFMDYEKIIYNEPTKEVILLNWSKHNWNNSPKVVKRVEEELKGVKFSPFIDMYRESIENTDFNKVSIQYPCGTDTVSTEYPNSMDIREKRKEKREKEKEKEKEKETETSQSVDPSLIDNNFLEIKNFYEENFYKSTFTDDKKMSEMLDNYQDHLLIIESMKIALERNKPTFNYMTGILDNWRKEHGITSFEQLNAKRIKEANQHGTNGTSNGRNHAKATGKGIDDVYRQLERDKQAWGD